MKRSDFLKAFGITIIAPSVLVKSERRELLKEIPTDKWDFKKYPIYPEVNSFSVKYPLDYHHTVFSYVKINRNGVDYLIPAKETGVGDVDFMKQTRNRFEYSAKQIQEHYIVDDKHVEMGFVIKYNPNIHKG